MRRTAVFFGFPVQKKDERHPQMLHRLRDCIAFSYLLSALYEQKLVSAYTGAIRNVTPGSNPEDLTPSDVVIATTRFPLHDVPRRDHKWIERSGTVLEQKLFAAIAPYFDLLKRGSVRLSAEAAQHLKPGFENRAHVAFDTHRGAKCLSFRTTKGHEVPDAEPRNRTLAYFLHLPSAWPDGPVLILSFGMGGEQGLLWNVLVKEKHAALLNKPQLVVAEFDAQTYKKDGPAILTCAGQLNEVLILQYPLC